MHKYSEDGDDWAFRRLPSHAVFMSFMKMDQAGKPMDASGLIGVECFNAWVKSRKGNLVNPDESFRRALTSHLCGSCGRKPFPEDVERLLLQEIRKNETWPCYRSRG